MKENTTCVTLRRYQWRCVLAGATLLLACQESTPAATNASGGAGPLTSSTSGGGNKATYPTATGGMSTLKSTVTTTTCNTGSRRCVCYGNDTCNAGLVCISGVCETETSSATTSAGAGNTSEVGGAGGAAGLASVSQGGLAAATSAHQGGIGGRNIGGAAMGGSNGVNLGGGNAGAANTSTTASSGNVPACAGLDPDSNTCNPSAIETLKPVALDLILLIDRSISMSYAVGSDAAKPASAGQVRRWDALTAGIERFASQPDAASIRASLTLFSRTGSAQTSAECTANDYAQPAVGLSNVAENKDSFVEMMQSIQPAGVTPLVPAATGALKYAIERQAAEPSVEKALVLIGDGFPTLCDQRAPSDVARVISEAAAAPVPIRTFIIGVGSPNTLSSAKFNLLNYASMGRTGKHPYFIDETAGADAVVNQLTQALLDIAASPRACTYALGTTRTESVSLVWSPASGTIQELPSVSRLEDCSNSTHGGFFFTDSTYSQVSLCPCSCSNLGAGVLTALHGCPSRSPAE